jgi:4-diphosphocytidyl-2-C-methyl-D-erythritol kinase
MNGGAPGEAWPAPGKLNLFLHVLGRRADGYHELQTAFQFIDLCDELTFAVRPDGRIVRSAGTPDIPEELDLAVRAARRLRDALKIRSGVEIQIHKRLPLASGLGGGSSDAATTLMALNQLSDGGLRTSELAALGLELGADVPVFVHGQAAWGEGVGERLTPIEPDERCNVVIRPPCAVSTREIFQAPELTRNSRPITIRAFFEGGGRNDCEPVVRARYPEVAAALDWLGRYGTAHLTGTGSCVFAAMENEERAREVLRELPQRWQGFAVRGRNRSPLLERLARAKSVGSGASK